jgi:hypothetical protein
MDRKTKFYYTTYVRTRQAGIQQNFVKTLLATGTTSSISNEDDYPVQTLNIPFKFPFFGELGNYVGLNPNGLISLPPIQPCESFPGFFLVFTVLYLIW